MKQSVLFLDWKIVDARVTEFHQAAGRELPVLVSVGPIPLAGVIAGLIREANSDPVPIERPQLLDEAILQLFGPFPRQKREDLFSTPEKFRAITPVTVLRIAACYLLGITCIPFILDNTDLQDRRLS